MEVMRSISFTVVKLVTIPVVACVGDFYHVATTAVRGAAMLSSMLLPQAK